MVRLNRLRATRRNHRRAGWAQFRLAVRYRDGDGVRPDIKKAAALFRQAAGQSTDPAAATAAREALAQLAPGGYQRELRLGFKLFIERDFGTALAAFTRCLAIRPDGADAARLNYNSAACHSLLGSVQPATDCLWRAFEHGLPVAELRHDPDFREMFASPEVERLLQYVEGKQAAIPHWQPSSRPLDDGRPASRAAARAARPRTPLGRLTDRAAEQLASERTPAPHSRHRATAEAGADPAGADPAAAKDQAGLQLLVLPELRLSLDRHNRAAAAAASGAALPGCRLDVVTGGWGAAELEMAVSRLAEGGWPLTGDNLLLALPPPLPEPDALQTRMGLPRTAPQLQVWNASAHPLQSIPPRTTHPIYC